MQLEFHQLDRDWAHLRARRPERERRLLASLAATGQQTPVVVVASGQPERYRLIDGYQRVAALEQLGQDTVEAVVWPLSEAEALLLARTLGMQERETALEEGWLLAELERRFGYGLEELARRFNRSMSWVSRRLALVELLPETVQQQVREGAITAHTAMKYLVPMARANVEDCRRMAAVLASRPYTSREAGQLYAAWRGASAQVRRRILEQPRLYLKARAEPAPEAADLLRDLEMVAAIASRAGRKLSAAADAMEAAECESARRTIECAQEQLRHLAAKIPREEQHVESQPTNHDCGTGRAGSEPARDRASAGRVAALGAARVALQFGGSAGVGAAGESRPIPAADCGVAGSVQGQPGPGP